MVALDPVALLTRYHDAVERQDFAALAGMFASDAEYRSPGTGGAVSGRVAIIESFRNYFAEFPDQQASDDAVMPVSPNAAESHWRLTATSRRTGKISERRGVEVVTFGPDGAIQKIEVEDLC